MNKEQIQFLSNLCFALGFLSIIGSVLIWFSAGGQFGAPGMGDAVAEAKRAYAERFGIFVGISRSQAIRDAVTELLKEKGVSERSRAFGIWKGKKIKSQEWVDAIRGEWHPA